MQTCEQALDAQPAVDVAALGEAALAESYTKTGKADAPVPAGKEPEAGPGTEYIYT